MPLLRLCMVVHIKSEQCEAEARGSRTRGRQPGQQLQKQTQHQQKYLPQAHSQICLDLVSNWLWKIALLSVYNGYLPAHQFRKKEKQKPTKFMPFAQGKWVKVLSEISQTPERKMPCLFLMWNRDLTISMCLYMCIGFNARRMPTKG